jgi:uroporphyrinogen-III synthase
MPLGPLEGFVIGVTADRRAGEQAELLMRRGATVLHGPTISTRYLANDDRLRRVTEQLVAEPPDALVATTGIGVRAWFEAAQAWGLADDLLAALRPAALYARGPKATAAVHVAGLPAPRTSDSERLDDVLALLTSEVAPGARVAFQHYGERNERAVERIAAAGADVVDVPVYRYGAAPDEGPALQLVEAVCDGRVDAVTFTSAPAAARLVSIADAASRRVALLSAFNDGGVVAGCIGPVCAEAALELGIREPLAPQKGRLGLLVRAITDVLQPRRRTFVVGGTEVVLQGNAVAVGSTTVSLSPNERSVLDALVRRPGVVVSKAVLAQLGTTADASGDRALEAVVARLRRRLGPAGVALRAVRGRGYCFDASAPVL